MIAVPQKATSHCLIQFFGHNFTTTASKMGFGIMRIKALAICIAGFPAVCDSCNAICAVSLQELFGVTGPTN